MLKKVLFLAIALGITIIATFVQQFATYDRPYKATLMINEVIYTLKLPVVHDANNECLIELVIPDSTVQGEVFYKVLNSSEEWHTNKLIRMSDNLLSILPENKPNVKLQYYIMLYSKSSQFAIAKEDPIVIRFQKDVPKYLQYPYVLLFFGALMMACFAGLLTVYDIDSYKKYARITFYLFSAAIFFAFIWHIVSFNHLFLRISHYNDLTFYKYLIIFLIWWGVYKINQKYELRYITLAASILTLILYSIPSQLVFDWISF